MKCVCTADCVRSCLLVATLLLGSAVAAQTVSLSSHKCIDEENKLEDEHRVCFFYDVFYFQGRLHYVSEDPKVVIPKISVRHGASNEHNGFLNPVVIHPSAVNFTQFSKVIQYGPETDVYLWSTVPENNWFHQTGEYMPTLHNTICKYLGRCTYADRRGLVLFEIFPGDFPWAPWLQDLVSCFSENPKVNVGGSRASVGQFISKALAGVGPECRARLFCGGASPLYHGRWPVPAPALRLFRERMGTCVGYDPARRAAVDPLRLVVVDRYYASARHLLNLDQIMGALRERYGSIANITLHYMEDMSARDQIRLWAGADLVVHVHGATQGSWEFLSTNAVVVHVVQRPSSGHDDSYARQWVSDLLDVTNITYFPVTNPKMTHAHLRTDVVRGKWGAVWDSLTPDQKLGVLEREDCKALGDDLWNTCAMWWIHKNLDLVLRLDLLLPQVDAAVQELYSRTGRTPPPGFPPPLPPPQPPRHASWGVNRRRRRLLQGSGGRRLTDSTSGLARGPGQKRLPPLS